MNHVLAIAKKELRAYFSSPVALIFVGTYLLVTLFVFFTIEGFFGREIADVRPLFGTLPIMMLFLGAALTMRLWSEEQKLGTLEVLLTLPVRVHHLVLGKFLGALALVAVALALTIGLPVTVSMLGELDWGPVVGGYFGGLLLASSYLAIGLFISALTQNQIVALIASVLACLALWLPGYAPFNDLFDVATAETLRRLSTSGRFESIARGVLDVRDVIYYLSLTSFFLVLNTLALRAKGWSTGSRTRPVRFNLQLFAILGGANLLLLNVWLAPIGQVRADMTKNHLYSLSRVTKDLVGGLGNPLLIRGYFSSRLHPKLAPMVPRLKDVIEEYAVVSGGHVRAEFLDPRDDEELEKEANQQYGIRSFPFPYETPDEEGIVNSYFSVLVKYGDQYEVIGFQDLIEIDAHGERVDVRLKNPEYDLTRAIKKVVYGFRTLEDMFAELDDKAEFTAYITPSKLPDNFKKIPEQVEKVLTDIAKQSDGKFEWKVVDPDAEGGQALKEELFKKYGFRPMAVSLFSEDSFYLHLLLKVGDKYTQVMPSESMAEADLKNEIIASIKRSTSGFLKTIGLVAPKEAPPPQAQVPGMPPPPRPPPAAKLAEQVLGENYTVENVDLSKGRVPGSIDALLVFAPSELDDTAAFAIDQYLMRGGSVMILGGRYELDTMASQETLALKKVTTGLESMLASYGVTIKDELVLDEQSGQFLVPVMRELNGFRVRELKKVRYPMFVDIRRNGMDSGSPLVAGLPSVTMQWASPVAVSPVEVDGKPLDRTVVEFLHSSDRSWTSTDFSSQPNYSLYPDLGYEAADARSGQTLAVAITGRFQSAFKGKKNPIWGGDAAAPPGASEASDGRTITMSSDNARLVVVGNSSFANGVVLGISRQISGDSATNNLQLLNNLVDWAVADTDLLTIRTAGVFGATLVPMSKAERSKYRWANYAFVMAALAVILGIAVRRRKSRQPISLDPSTPGAPASQLNAEVG